MTYRSVWSVELWGLGFLYIARRDAAVGGCSPRVSLWRTIGGLAGRGPQLAAGRHWRDTDAVAENESPTVFGGCQQHSDPD